MRSWVWKGKGKHGDIEESQTKNCFGWFPSLSVSLILFFWLCAFYFIFWYIKKCKASVIDIQFKKKKKKRAHVNKTVVECLVQIHTLRRKIKFPEFGHNQVKLFPNFNMSIIGLHINVVEYNCPLSSWLCCLILTLMK